MAQVTQAIVVDRPVDEVYDDWTDAQALAGRFDNDVEVEAVAPSTTRWTVPAGASRHQVVVRQIHTSSRRDIVWLSLSGPRLAGRISFRPLGALSTCVRLSVDFDPRNPLGWLAEHVGLPDRALQRVLLSFKRSVEHSRAGDGARPSEHGPDYEIADHPRPAGDVDLRRAVDLAKQARG